MLRVAFDATSLAFEKKTGTGVYTYEVIKAYQDTFLQDKVVNTYRLSRFIKGHKYFIKNNNYTQNQVMLDPVTFWRGYSYDIFHGLNARLPFLCGVPLVVTIHDLFSVFGDYSHESFKADQKIKYINTLKKAHHIIVPAQYTKDLMLKHLEIPESKVSVVGEGVREIFIKNHVRDKCREYIKEKYKIVEPYYLFVGTLEKRKNIIGILKAFHQFKLQNKTKHKLVFIGSPGFEYEKIKSEIIKLNLQDSVVELGYMAEVELAYFYTCCEAFLFLSFEEGFGIPVIEAMACGAPVISSNTTSLPEVGGGHSFLVEPTNYDKAAYYMMQIIKKEASTQNKIEASAAYAKQLTWGKVALNLREQYLKIIDRYLGRQNL